jgi:uncharacterized integral membrane protein (TIGR00698 family)
MNTSPALPLPPQPVPMRAAALLPGLLITAGLAACAYLLRTLPGVRTLSPMVLAIVLGMAVRALTGSPEAAQPGIGFSLRRVLRLAIVLLGLQLTTRQVAELGVRGVTIVVVVLVATFLFTRAVGRLLRVSPQLAELIAGGTAICGASAVVAVNTVTEAADEDVAYAIACVTVFGTASMFLFPVLGTLLHLPPVAYGLWTGSAIHEVAQVVGAAFQHGAVAGEFGTVAKLTRVMLLAPLVIGLGALARRRPEAASRRPPPLPWFVLGFVALAGVNSLGLVPARLHGALVPATGFLLTMALAAMGLETDFRRLAARGLRPLGVGALAWLFVSAASLALIELAF